MAGLLNVASECLPTSCFQQLIDVCPAIIFLERVDFLPCSIIVIILPKRHVFNVLIAISHYWLAIFWTLVSPLFAKIPVCAIIDVLPQLAPYQAAK